VARYFVRIACLFVALAAGSAVSGPAAAQEYGIAVKKPVMGAACPSCPWGALADKVKAAMEPLGYQVQICYNCSQENSTRIVSERRVPPPRRTDQMDLPEPPQAPVDFGAVGIDIATHAYHGTGFYAGESPRKNLRLIAKLESPSYYLVAARLDLRITDLGQIRERKLPVRIYTDFFGASILDQYGLTKENVESWGGRFLTAAEHRSGINPDIVAHFTTSLNNTPESNIWYVITQRDDYHFLQVSDAALKAFVDKEKWEIGTVPVRLMRGLEKAHKVPVNSGHLVYGRDDMPDQFAYDVAKAIDLGKRSLIYSIIPFSFNPDEVWKARDLPLHPGAERYYREVGDMK
jgi:TRAP-type uncharacterized transport system substrate-binding protein